MGRRAIAFAICVVAIFATWLTAPVAVAGVPAPTALVMSYDYDNHAHVAPLTHTAERGPPTSYDQIDAHDAVDRCLRGASARSGGRAAHAIYDYDDRALLVHSARGSGNDLEEPVGSAEAGPEVPPGP